MTSLLALDIDGTVLDHDERLSEAVRQGVRDVVHAGHDVVLSTGRSVTATLPVLARLGLVTGFAVCSNGAVTIALDPALEAGYRVLRSRTFDPGPALRLLRDHLPTAGYAVEDLGGGELGTRFRLHGPFPDGELTEPVVVVGFDELLSRPVTRVVVRSPEHTPQDFLELTARLGLHGVNYAVGWTAWLDIAPEGVSKATALELVREDLGVASVDTVAVGDGRNDLEMFGWAARAVAMGNASPEVLAAADESTGDVTEDGLVPVLRSLLG